MTSRPVVFRVPSKLSARALAFLRDNPCPIRIGLRGENAPQVANLEDAGWLRKVSDPDTKHASYMWIRN